MHPVLHLLIVWDRDEQQELAPIARGDQTLLVSRLVRVIRIFDEVQNLRPEQRLRVGVDGVEGRVRDTAGHGDSPDSSRQDRQTGYGPATCSEAMCWPALPGGPGRQTVS